jgi:hypothetical protein
LPVFGDNEGGFERREFGLIAGELTCCYLWYLEKGQEWEEGDIPTRRRERETELTGILSGYLAHSLG